MMRWFTRRDMTVAEMIDDPLLDELADFVKHADQAIAITRDPT